MFFRFYKEAKAYILYRDTYKKSRFIKERLDYMNNYSQSDDNAASSSETDANANLYYEVFDWDFHFFLFLIRLPLSQTQFLP
jgi:hypothetical protein